jgi:RNA polymerase Rpb4
MELGGLEESEAPEDEPSLLLSNVEVLEHLQRNLAENRSTHKRWKDRDWVQAQVVQYLQSTPCTRLDPSRRREFQSLLESRKKRAAKKAPPSLVKTNPETPLPTSPSPLKVPSAEPPFPDSAPSSRGSFQPQNALPTRDSDITSRAATAAAASSAPDESEDDESPCNDDGNDEAIATGFGLARSEALQILNFMPSEVVELHLLIDDLDGRFSTKQQDGLLDAISRYTRTQPADEEDASAAGDVAVTTVEAASVVEERDKVCATNGEQMNGH